MSRMSGQHGTLGCYTHWRCRCAQCREAWARYCREQKQRRAAEPTPDHLHGTENGYGNYGCRCRACTDAWSDAATARSRRRRERMAAS